MLVAFGLYAIVVEQASAGPSMKAGEEGPEITVFTMAFQAVGYALAMALANLLYGLGPLSEKLVRPSNPSIWRRATFALGLVFSVALPFAVPLTAFFTWLRPR